MKYARNAVELDAVDQMDSNNSPLFGTDRIALNSKEKSHWN